MKKLKILKSITNAIIGDPDDKQWNEWLNLKKEREPKDLHELIKSNVRAEFKMRAITVLLSPDLKSLPFKWNGDKNSTLRNYLFILFDEEISNDLFRFTGDLVCKNIDYCIKYKKDTEVYRSMFAYNRIILKFLSMLPEEDELSKNLFARYQINDPVEYWNMDEASGYNPFFSIIYNETVPEKWKVLADKQMRNCILAEIEGRQTPRNDWEKALPCYTSHIQMANYDGKSFYSSELLISQIDFILSLPGIEKYDNEIFSSWQIIYHLNTLLSNGCRDLAHKLAQQTVLVGKKEHFTVFDSKSREAADLMLQEWSDDIELVDKLNLIIGETTIRQTINDTAKSKEEEKANKVLSKMM